VLQNTDACMASVSAEREAILQGGLCERFAVPENPQVIYRGLASCLLLGVEKKTNVRVAIKALLKSRFQNEKELKQSLREIELHASVPRHKNVLELLYSEEQAFAITLVFPYTPDGDLWELMRYGQTYCEKEVRNCTEQLLSALHHVHTANILHGDIKPHNFLLFRVDGRFAVQLCDFGFAEHPDQPGGVCTHRELKGTHGWFAPEMLAEQSHSFSLDLFGIGLILWRLLAGYAPFDPPSCFLPLDFDERYWCHVSSPCRELVAQLLSLTPGNRGTAAQSLQHVWLAGGEPPEPSAEVMQELAKYGAPPQTSVHFWPVGLIPSKEWQKSYANLVDACGDTSQDELSPTSA